MNRLTKLAFEKCPVGVKTNIRKVLPLRIKRWLGARLMAGISDGRNTITLPDGRVFLVIEDRVFLRVYYEGVYEPQLTNVVEKLLIPGDKAVDVGANFGWYTILLAKCVENGLVVSYEPNPHSYKILQENIRLNDFSSTVNTKSVCVGNHEGLVALNVESSRDSGLAHVQLSSDDEVSHVPTVRLSSELDRYKGRIAFIKIDVEGFEFSVLEGSKSLLEVDNQPIIQIELNDEALHRAGTTRFHVLEFLSDMNYKFWDIKEAGELFRTNGDGCTDVFCAGMGIFATRVEKLTLKNRIN